MNQCYKDERLETSQLILRGNYTVEDLKRSYRKLAFNIHPDRNPQDTKATARFIALTASYERLLDDLSSKNRINDRIEVPHESPLSRVNSNQGSTIFHVNFANEFISVLDTLTGTLIFPLIISIFVRLFD